MLVVGVVGHPPQPSMASTQSASNYLASCAQSADTLSALFVFDQSGSLKGTDPSGIRYDALQSALEQLSQMRSSVDDNLAVEVAVASFDNAYYPVRDIVRWTRLDSDAFGGDTNEQRKTVERIVELARERTAPDGGTDFEAALEGAFADMADRGGPGNCRVIFWFTDGEFENARDSVDAARGRMCRTGGLLDEIRRAGIVLVGIQLNDNATDLWPMSEGRGGFGAPCGTVPIPSDLAPGLYIRADDTGALKRIFGSVVDIVQGCTPIDPSSKLVDPGIRRFRSSLNAPSRIEGLRLDAPDGTIIDVPLSGSTQQGSYVVTAQADDQYVLFEVELPPGQGAGRWTFTSDPAITAQDVSMCVYHDLHLELADPQQQVSAGEPTEIVIDAVGPDGVATDLSVFGEVAVGASALGPDHEIRPAVAQIRDGQVVVALETLPIDPRIELSLAMNVSTASGLALTPVSARFPIQVRLSQEFPVVTPSDEIDLGLAVKINPTSATLSLMGSPVGPTEVCFGAFTALVVPDEAAGTTPEVSDTCVALQTGESYDVTVSVTPAAAAEGAGSASLPITLRSAADVDRPSQEVRYEVPVLWRFSNPLNTPVAIAVILIIGLLSVVLPLLAIGLANLLSAKFNIRHLEAGSVPVIVRDGRVTRAHQDRDDSGRLVNWFLDRDQTARVDHPRRFTLFSVEFEAKGSINPFGAPRFTVTAPPGHKIMSTVGSPIPGDHQALVSPGLGFVGLAIAAETDLNRATTQVPATLILLTNDTEASADPDLIEALVRQQMPWDRITDDWRPGPGDHDFDFGGSGGGSTANVREPEITDDPFFD